MYNNNTCRNETNPYLRKLDQLQEAKKKWADSEMLLDFLRTQGSVKPVAKPDEELLQWQQNLQ